MILICIEIFLARVVDVTLGTVRTIFIVHGRKNIASIIAFFEVLIWFLVANEALLNTSHSILVPIFYSLGFAVGTYIGIIITNKYIKSFITAQITTKKDNIVLINILRDNGYGVSVVSLKNEKDNIKKDLLYVSINKNSSKDLIKLVKKIDKNAFIIFNDVKHVTNGLIK